MIPVPVTKESLRKPSPSYQRQVYLTMAGLLLFGMTYLGGIVWLLWSAVSHAWVAWQASELTVGFLLSLPGLFLAIILINGLRRVRRPGTDGLIELRLDEHPALLTLIYDVADEVNAPRPHRVFLSPEVNAAVFYERSAKELLFPTRKNLMIGIGLVNIVTMDEFRAVLAHEFGHFSQKSMRISSWVYLAGQVVEDLLSGQDGIDRSLRPSSALNVGLAFVVRAVFWAVRVVMGTAFYGVMLLARALSREMEFQADRVAVSAAGSDSLVHALYRLRLADSAWGEAMKFAASEAEQGRIVEDLYAVQDHFAVAINRALGRPGRWCPPTERLGAEFRLFAEDRAGPPRMWATHPPGGEREDHCKEHYFPSVIDERTPWELFNDPAQIRRDVNRLALPDGLRAGALTPIRESLAEIDRVFGAQHMDGRYRGRYFLLGRVCEAVEVDRLYAPVPLERDELLGVLDGLYPERLTADLERLEVLDAEIGRLILSKAPSMQAAGWFLQRDRWQSMRQIDAAIQRARQEWKAVRQAILTHDQEIRSVHLAMAQALGSAPASHLKGLLAVIHCAEHSLIALQVAAKEIRQASRGLSQTPGSPDREQLILRAGAAHLLLHRMRAEAVELGGALAARMGGQQWAGIFGADLPEPSPEEMRLGWEQRFEVKARQVGSSLRRLRGHSLDLLLELEANVERCWRAGAPYSPLSGPLAALSGPIPAVPPDFTGNPVGPPEPMSLQPEFGIH